EFTQLISDQPLIHVRKLLNHRKKRSALVVKAGECIGLISETELSKARTDLQLNSPVKAFMRRDVPSVYPDQGVQEVLKLFGDMEVAMLPVLEKDKIVGALTRSDLLLQLYHNF
ncbi:MAG: CBS domain-containing protein, partial [Desulfovibrionales bacterium]